MTQQVITESEVFLWQESALVRSFFGRVLGIDAHDCFISEESELSDFSFRGEGYDCPEVNSLSVLHNDWDQWIITQLRVHYAVEVSSTKIPLMQLFQMLDSSQQTKALLH